MLELGEGLDAGRAGPVLSMSGPAATGPGTAEERFRGLLESAPDAMVIVDASGLITLVNARTEAVFGHRREDLLGRPVEMLVPERFRAHHRLHCLSHAGGRQVRRMGEGQDLKGLRRDGSEFPVEISLSPLETADGLLFFAAVRDVSERKAAEKRIGELAAIAESSRDAILAKTLDGRITYWNGAAQRLYGYSAEEAIGRHVSMIAPPDHRDEIGELLRRLARGEQIERYETVRITRDGRRLDVELTLWPTRSTDGEVAGACAIIRDVSERKRRDAELDRLYQQQRHVALTLQRSLMGPEPRVPGLRTASRYRPATEGEGVGGDWFDLIPLGAGRIGVLIADVMGRGLEAAAVMGQLRSAAHALAKTGMQPRQLLQALDSLLDELPDQFVTCCYLVIDPDTGEVTAASAGHLPVMLVEPGTGARALPVPVSVPLGVGDVPHRQERLRIPSDGVLALYTDGLIETPGTDIEEQLGLLTRALDTAFADPSRSLEDAADHVLRELLPAAGRYDDDVTLLLARLPAGSLDTASTELAGDPSSVAAGRRFLAAALTAWGCTDILDDARLLASELLTNAVHHAEGPVLLRVRRTELELTVEVADHSSRLPLPRLAGPDEESGRGLQLVESLAENWGTLHTDEGKVTWFSLSPRRATGQALSALRGRRAVRDSS